MVERRDIEDESKFEPARLRELVLELKDRLEKAEARASRSENGSRSAASEADSGPLSSRKYRELMSGLKDGVVEVSLGGEILEFNEAFQEMVGYPSSELPGMNFEDFTPRKWHESEREIIRNQVMARGYSEAYEKEYLTADGRTIPIELRAYLRTDAQGKPIGMWALVRDVSERKRYESRIKRSEEKYRALFEASPDSITLIGLNGEILDLNQATIDLSGFTSDAVFGKSFLDFGWLDPEEIPGFVGLFSRLLKGESVDPVQLTIKQPDGSARIAEARASVIMEGESPRMIQVITRDVTESHDAVKELRESEAKMRSIFNSGAMGIVLLDPDMRIADVNSTVEVEALGVFGTVLKEGVYFPGLLGGEVQKDFIRNFGRAMRGELIRVETSVLDVAGARRYFDLVYNPILGPHGKVTGVSTIVIPTDERKAAEEELKRSEERFRTMADLSPFPISIIERDGQYSYVNNRFVEVFGYELEDVPSGRRWFELAYPDEEYRREVIGIWTSDLKNSRPGQVRPRSFRVRVKNGQFREIIFRPVTVTEGRQFVTYEDVTDRKRMEEELLKAQKLESMGILAGGIAHDFNNILTSIRGNINLVKIKRGEHAEELLEEADAACARAGTLTKQLLTFARGGAPLKSVATISDLIRESADFSLRGSNVKCEYEIDADLLPAEVDSGQISQVVNNIVINADQAMPEGGILQIRAGNAVFTSPESSPGGKLQPGEYVRISFQDSGVGIPSRHLSKIFDPYYSTKQKGSGLGLAISYSIVKRHDGHIDIESEIGKGTAVTVYLPATREKAPIRSDEFAGVERGEGRILVMDDEAPLRKLAGALLENLGYEYETTGEGSEAIETYRRAMESSRPFDAVIMDLTIPGGMGGKEAAANLLRLDPAARIIVSSGYSNDPVMARHGEYGFLGVIAKPYHVTDFARELKRVLGLGRDPGSS